MTAPHGRGGNGGTMKLDAYEERRRLEQAMDERAPFLVGRYCPRCGARRLQHVYHGFIVNSETGSLRCALCGHAFQDSAEGRWTIMKFDGTSARKTRVGEFTDWHPRNRRIAARVLGRDSYIVSVKRSTFARWGPSQRAAASAAGVVLAEKYSPTGRPQPGVPP